MFTAHSSSLQNPCAELVFYVRIKSSCTKFAIALNCHERRSAPDRPNGIAHPGLPVNTAARFS